MRYVISKYDMDFIMWHIGIFHAGWFCNVGNRIYKSKKCRKYCYEKYN